MNRLGPTVLVALLSGCATPARPPAPTDAAMLAARLPVTLAGFERGGVLPLPGGAGREVSYATVGRIAAAATVEIDEPRGGPDGPDPAALAAWSASADADAPGRRLSPVAAPAGAGIAALACTMLEGRLGRERVSQMLCAGTVAGAPIRLRVGMPVRDPPVADAASWAAGVVAALAAR